MEVIGGTGDINADIEKFCTSFSPLLEENHKFLVRNKIYGIIFMLEDDHRMTMILYYLILSGVC